jgi:hypothetical protein
MASGNGKSPDALHKDLIASIKANPVQVYNGIKARFSEKGLATEMPEFAPVVHYLKWYLHNDHEATPTSPAYPINTDCMTDRMLRDMRNQADLALWHVSVTLAWYPYFSTLRAIFQTLQFLDNYARQKQPELRDSVPYYHEFRYLLYFDWLIQRAPEVILIPCVESLGETPLILTRSAPIFLIGVNPGTIHVDEYIQTPAEFFIHDINHARRQFENSLQAKETFYKDLSLNEYYAMQHAFITEKIRPLIILGDKSPELAAIIESFASQEEKADLPVFIKGLKGVMKNILFEVLHEEADPALNELICSKVLKPSGAASPFQFVTTSKVTGTRNLKRVTLPGGSILGFVRFKLRYGFFDAEGKLSEVICPKEFRTSDKIAKGALVILNFLKCANIPSYEEVLALVDDNRGLNPPVHHNHLGLPFDPKTFTGIRPPSLPTYMFEEMYAQGVPWVGLEKPEVKVEDYSASGEFVGENFGHGREATASAQNAGGGKYGGSRKTRKIRRF